jgi:Domain of unknown function (DUF6883)
MRLPNADAANVSRDKVVEYLLNPQHPDGAAKAAFFAAMGFHVDRWQELANALKRLAEAAPVTVRVDSPHGSKYIVDGAIDTPSGRSVSVRSVWIVDRGSQAPRLVTTYPRQQEV